jgi:hypothetical protein
MRNVNLWDFSDFSVLCRNGRRSVSFSEWESYNDNNYVIPAKSHDFHKGFFLAFYWILRALT